MRVLARTSILMIAGVALGCSSASEDPDRDSTMTIPGEAEGLFVQDQLKRVGVAVEIRAVEWAAAQSAWREGDYDAMVNWVETPPRDILGTWFESSPFGYHDAEAVQLLETLDSEPDPAAHRRIHGFRPGWNVLGSAEELWIEGQER